MLNYEDLNTETLVARAGQTSGVTTLSMGRGNVNFGVQYCQGSTNCAAPTGAVPWFGLKAQANMQGPWLSNVQLAPIAGSTGLYQAILQNNTPELIALMHADPNDPVPELLSVPVYGQFYYFLPGQADPVASQVITVNVTAVLWNGAEGIAPSANPVWPTAAAVTTAVAQAAAADTPAARNTAIANAFAALPAPVNTSTAPIQPFSAYLAAMDQLQNYTTLSGGVATLNLSALGITALDPRLILSWAQIMNWAGASSYALDLAGNALVQAQQDNLFNALATFGQTQNAYGSTLDVSGGASAPVSPVPAQCTLDFSAVNVAAIIAGGNMATFYITEYGGGDEVEVSLDPTITAAESGTSYTNVGISDSPSLATIASIAANLMNGANGAQGFSFSSSGNTVALTDSDAAGNYSAGTDPATGIILTLQNPGYSDAALNNLQNTNAWMVTHN